MSISVNGQSKVPPGFRFHPTEEELLQYYLRKKVCFEEIDLDVIKDVDLNKLEPWDIQEMCKIGSTPQNDWYFFSHKDKKYPSSTRTNRATAAGFWKATGRDKAMYSSNGRGKIGMRKTLVFYKGRAPHGLKCDWIMHEYRLLDNNNNKNSNDDANIINNVSCGMEKTCKRIQDEGWVICRIFKKKNPLIKTLENPIITTANSSIITTTTSTDDQTTARRPIISSNITNDEGTLEEIINMGRTSCKVDKKDATDNMRQLLINPTVVVDTTSNNDGDHLQHNEYFVKLANLETINSVFYNSSEIGLSNWARIDDPLAMDFGSFNSSIDHYDDHPQILLQFPLSTSSSPLPYYTPCLFNDQTDLLWSFTRSSLQPNSPVCRMSDSPV
ncbi:hypothetical protein LguiA_029029 [Lonicera macranthoides]